MGLWAIAKSPIILGNDLSKISQANLALVKNKGLIAINQDPLGKAAGYFQPPGKPAPTTGRIYPYWAGPLSDGVVIGLVSAGSAQTLSVNFKDVPGLGSGTYSWVEYFSGRSGSGTSVSFSLATDDIAVVKVTKTGGFVPNPASTGGDDGAPAAT
jgi:alpha-galactosidase